MYLKTLIEKLIKTNYYMQPLNEALNMSPEQIDQQIKLRMSLRQSFISTLYKDVLTDEINQLKEQYRMLVGDYNFA